jgi:hypothetical protein
VSCSVFCAACENGAPLPAFRDAASK